MRGRWLSKGFNCHQVYLRPLRLFQRSAPTMHSRGLTLAPGSSPCCCASVPGIIPMSIARQGSRMASGQLVPKKVAGLPIFGTSRVDRRRAS